MLKKMDISLLFIGCLWTFNKTQKGCGQVFWKNKKLGVLFSIPLSPPHPPVCIHVYEQQNSKKKKTLQKM